MTQIAIPDSPTRDPTTTQIQKTLTVTLPADVSKLSSSKSSKSTTILPLTGKSLASKNGRNLPVGPESDPKSRSNSLQWSSSDLWVILQKYGWGLRYSLNFTGANNSLNLNDPLVVTWVKNKPGVKFKTAPEISCESNETIPESYFDLADPKSTAPIGSDTWGYEFSLLEDGCTVEIRLTVVKGYGVKLLTPYRESREGEVFKREDYTVGSKSRGGRRVNPFVLYLEGQGKGGKTETDRSFPARRMTHCWVNLSYILGIPNPLSAKPQFMGCNEEICETA